MAGHDPSRLANLGLLFCLTDLIVAPAIYFGVHPIFDIAPTSWETIFQLTLFIVGMAVYVIGFGSYFAREIRFRIRGDNYENEIQEKAGHCFHFIEVVALMLYLLVGQQWLFALMTGLYMGMSTCVSAIVMCTCASSSSQDGNNDDDDDDENSRLIESV